MDNIFRSIGGEWILLFIWLMWSWVFYLFGMLTAQKRLLILFSLIWVRFIFSKEISWFEILSGGDFYVSNFELSIIIIILVFIYELFQQEEETDSSIFIVFCLMLWSVFVWMVTVDFLYFLVCFEILSSTFSYLSYNRIKDIRNLCSKLEYYHISGLSFVFLLLSLVGFYFMSGTLSFIDWRNIILRWELVPEVLNQDLLVIRLCTLYLFISLSFKWYLFPNNYWIIYLFDVCDKNRILIIGCVYPILYLLIFLKWYLLIFSCFEVYFRIIGAVFGLMTFIISIRRLINKLSIRRVIACSTINHLGSFIFFYCLTEGSLSKYTFFYMVSYISNMVILVTFLQKVQNSNGKSVERIDMFSWKERPLIGLWCSITLFFWGGFPPYWGFFFKTVFTVSYSYSFDWLVILFFFFCSLISRFCFLRIIRKMFFSKEYVKIVYRGGVTNSILFSVLTLLNVMSLFIILRL